MEKTGEKIPKTIMAPMVTKIAEVTGFDENLNYGHLARIAKNLVKAGYTQEQVAEHYARQNGRIPSWYQKDWRGKRGQRPTPENIVQTIGIYVGASKAQVIAPPVEEVAEEEALEEEAELSPELKKVWLPVLDNLKWRISPAVFDTFIRPAQPLSFSCGVLTVDAPDQTIRDWLESRLKSTIVRMLVGICASDKVDVRFVVRGG